MLVVVLGIDLREEFLDATLGIDDERRAEHAHIFAAAHRFLTPHAVCLTYAVIRIGQKRKVQFVLLAEILMRLLAVGTYADDAESHLGELSLAVTQALGLEGTSRSVVLRVEIKNYALTFEVVQRKSVPGLGRRSEVGSQVPYL